MVEAGHSSTVSFSVVINPNSGPGDSSEDGYTTGMTELVNAGVEVLCYVPTGFGSTDVSQVTRDIDAYESFYPSLCGGYFFDEGPGTEENTWKYTYYYNHAQLVSGSDSTVVVNPGVRPHDSLYNIGDLYAVENPDMGGQVVITSFENTFEVFVDGSQQYPDQEVPFPPRYVQDRHMHSILVYAAYFSTLKEYLDWTVFQLYCANWGYVFFTDDTFGDDENPWDALPSYFMELLEAVEKAPESATTCGTWAPTPAPTDPWTFAPLAPGETRPPVPTPAPMEFSTAQPASLGGTRAPTTPPPTVAPTLSPTASPTRSPTVMPSSHPTASPTEMPTPSPTPAPTPAPTTAAPVPPTEREGSGGQRRGGSSSLPSPATLFGGAVLLATALWHGVPL
eukprot:g10521.t1